jgi:hypothetical protein
MLPAYGRENMTPQVLLSIFLAAAGWVKNTVTIMVSDQGLPYSWRAAARRTRKLSTRTGVGVTLTWISISAHSIL